MNFKNNALVVITVIALMSCSTRASEEDKENKAEPEIPVLELKRQNATLDQDYAGHLEAIQNVEVRARVAGYLDKILVDEGQPVRQGQLLFQLNPAEYQVKVTEAKASIESATAQEQSALVEIERVKLLVDKNVISPSELKLARTKVAAARASIDQAKAALANAQLLVSLTSIRAPFDGVINRLPFKRGSLIEEGALLTTISDLREMYAYFNVSEKEYLSFVRKRNDPNHTAVREVDLFLADDSPYSHKGKIETTETVFEGNDGTIAFRARFPNPKRLLRHGASGKVRLSNEVDDALLVPQKAVFEVQDKSFVYVVDGGNKVRTRPFIPRNRFDQFYIVQSGLKAGDRVVYEGIQNLKEGMKIVPRPLPDDSLKALFAAIP